MLFTLTRWEWRAYLKALNWSGQVDHDLCIFCHQGCSLSSINKKSFSSITRPPSFITDVSPAYWASYAIILNSESPHQQSHWFCRSSMAGESSTLRVLVYGGGETLYCMSTVLFYLVVPCQNCKQLCHVFHHQWRVEVVPHSCTQCAPAPLIHIKVPFFQHIHLELYQRMKTLYIPFPLEPFVNSTSLSHIASQGCKMHSPWQIHRKGVFALTLDILE